MAEQQHRTRINLQKKNRTRYFKIFLALRNRETTLREKRTTPRPHITAKNETARSVKFDEHFARPMSFEEPFATFLNH